MTDQEVNIKFGGDTSGLQQSLDVVTASTRGFSQSLMADMAAANTAIASTAVAATDGANKLNFATAGATREFIVLGREALTGNFSRMSGTLITLANRMGGLQSIMASVTLAQVGWVAAITATVALIYEWAEASERLEQTQNTVHGALDLAGQSLSYNADQVARNILYMREYGSSSAEEAEKIAISLSRNASLTTNMQNQLVRFVDTWRGVVSAKDNVAAAESMAKVFSDPAKAIGELAQKYPNLVSAQEEWRIEQDQAVNGAQHAAQMFLDDIGPKLLQFKNDYVDPNITAWEHLKRIMTDFTNPLGSFNLPSRQAATTGPDDAQLAQQQQTANNEAELEGLQIAQREHGENEVINNLLTERASLIKGINAAMNQNDDSGTIRQEQALEDIDQKIADEKKRQNSEAVADAKRAAQQEIDIEREKADTIKQLDSIQFQQERDLLQARVDSGEISKQQEIAQLQQLADQEYNISYQGYLNELQNDNLTLQDKQKVYDQIQILYAKHQQEMASLSAQSAAAEKQQWTAVSNTISNSLDQMLRGVLQGTQTWRQAMARLADDLALSLIEAATKSAVTWVVQEAVKTSASLAGDATRTASSTAAAGAGLAVQAASATKSIGISAGQAAASVYADVAAIPYVGWLLAPPAAAAAFVAVEAFGGGIASAAGGMMVDQDQLAMVHQNEMILPANISSGLLGMIGEGGGGGGNYNISISAVDSQSFVNLLQSSQGQKAIIQTVNQNIRNTGGKTS